MSHKDNCRAGCSDNPTQAELERNHGTPAEFAKAVRNAWDFLSPAEMEQGIRRYESEWYDAGRIA